MEYMSDENQNNVDNNEPTGGTARLDAADVFLPEPGADISHSLPEDIDSQPVNIADFRSIIDSKDPNHIDDKAKVPADDKGEKTVGTDGEKKADTLPTTKVDYKPISETVTPAETAKVTTPTESPEAKYGESVKFFPKMAKEAREHFRARLDENIELKARLKANEEKLKTHSSGLPVSYLDHPEAFTLDPKYREATTQYNNIANELKFYQNQLVAIRNGDKWQMPVQDKDGKWSYREMEPSAESDVHVTDLVMRGRAMLDNQQRQVNELSQNFKNSYEAQRKEFKDLSDYYFPNYAGEKAKDNKFIKVMDDIIKDKGQDNNILAPFLSRLYAFSMEQAEFIKANQDKWNSAGRAKPTVQPSSADINNTISEKKTGIHNQVYDHNAFLSAKEA